MKRPFQVHECPECGLMCDCDSEDHAQPAPTECECEINHEEEGWDSDDFSE